MTHGLAKALGWYATETGKAAYDIEGRSWPINADQAAEIDKRRMKK